MKSELDPFRVIVGVLATRRDSDLIVGVANAAGLSVDLTLSPAENHTHQTRIRTLLPRILGAYDGLSDEAKLAVANIAFRNFGPAYPNTRDRAVEALKLAGWEVHGEQLVAGSAEVIEMFFPKGSQWNSHIALRDALNQATTNLTILDPYTDSTVFQMLSARPLAGLSVKILCGASGLALAAEARAFIAQHPGVRVEVRQTKDFHDRFIVVDDQVCLHVGASIKDAGQKGFMVSRVQDESNVHALLSAIDSAWKNATTLL